MPGKTPGPTPTKGRGRAARRSSDPTWARFTIMIGALLMLASGGAIVANDLIFTVAGNSIKQQDLLGDSGNQAAAEDGHVEITGPKNILLIGNDARPLQNPTDQVRADSIIIMHIPAAHDRAYLVSIPRDTWIQIPPYDNGTRKHPGGYNKINAAYAFGGDGLTGDDARRRSTELLAKTIKQAFGVTFDAAAIVDFQGFQKVVAVLGGVEMYVDQETTSVHRGFTADGKLKIPYRQYPKADGSTGLERIAGVTPKTYKVGHQRLTPDEALDYVRQRELLPNSDYDRERHQQQFIKALFRQILSSDVLTNPVKLKKVLDVVGSAITLDRGGVALEDWIYAMRGVSADSMVTIKTNKGTFNASTRNPGAESLDDDTLALLKACQDDTVDAFVLAHPELVMKS
ncbi:MAG TPA: LCP family protein [Micromonosporaceae bacterium]|nr:LCP family protein [Micromonosporaceae bacterium]